MLNGRPHSRQAPYHEAISIVLPFSCVDKTTPSIPLNAPSSLLPSGQRTSNKPVLVHCDDMHTKRHFSRNFVQFQLSRPVVYL